MTEYQPVQITNADYIEYSNRINDLLRIYKVSVRFLAYKIDCPEYDIKRLSMIHGRLSDTDNFSIQYSTMCALFTLFRKMDSTAKLLVSTKKDFDYLEHEPELDTSIVEKQTRFLDELTVLSKILLTERTSYSGGIIKILGVPIIDFKFDKVGKQFSHKKIGNISMHKIYLAAIHPEYNKYLNNKLNAKRGNSKDTDINE